MHAWDGSLRISMTFWIKKQSIRPGIACGHWPSIKLQKNATLGRGVPILLFINGSFFVTTAAGLI